MQEREAQKIAAAAAAAAAASNGASASKGRVVSPIQGGSDLHRISSNGSRDERRRSRALSATLLEAVGEEARETSGGVHKAAEWRRSISGLEQLDPRAAKPSNPATPSSTRPTSPQPHSGRERASPNPFPAQSLDSRKRLSETDRRRLSQGAGDRSSRRYSQPLLDFDLPSHRNQ